MYFLNKTNGEKENVYSGISYIHEFTGENVGKYMGLSIKRAKLDKRQKNSRCKVESFFIN